jgi:hypothetical protein
MARFGVKTFLLVATGRLLIPPSVRSRGVLNVSSLPVLFLTVSLLLAISTILIKKYYLCFLQGAKILNVVRGTVQGDIHTQKTPNMKRSDRTTSTSTSTTTSTIVQESTIFYI